MQSKRRNWSNTVPWIALLIAIYGASLSTIQWHDSRAEKARRLDVSLSFDAPIAKGVLQRGGLLLKATNPGYQVVTVTAAGLILPDGKICLMSVDSGEWQFPKRIAPGENSLILYTGQHLAYLCNSVASRGFNGTVTLIGFCVDGEDKFHKSVPLQFNIEDALKLARAQATSPKVRENQRHSQ